VWTGLNSSLTIFVSQRVRACSHAAWHRHRQITLLTFLTVMFIHSQSRTRYTLAFLLCENLSRRVVNWFVCNYGQHTTLSELGTMKSVSGVLRVDGSVGTEQHRDRIDASQAKWWEVTAGCSSSFTTLLRPHLAVMHVCQAFYCCCNGDWCLPSQIFHWSLTGNRIHATRPRPTMTVCCKRSRVKYHEMLNK